MAEGSTLSKKTNPVCLVVGPNEARVQLMDKNPLVIQHRAIADTK